MKKKDIKQLTTELFLEFKKKKNIKNLLQHFQCKIDYMNYILESKSKISSEQAIVILECILDGIYEAKLFKSYSLKHLHNNLNGVLEIINKESNNNTKDKTEFTRQQLVHIYNYILSAKRIMEDMEENIKKYNLKGLNNGK